MQSHYAAKSIEGQLKSQIFLSKKPDGRLLFFIHGFCGKAVRTWINFPLYLTIDPEFSGCDFVFWGYDSFKRSVPLTAGLLRPFLNNFLSKPSIVANQAIGVPIRDETFGYNKIVFSAHSLGALILRRCLCDAATLNANWLDKTQTVLFAPAHQGATIEALASEAVGGYPTLNFLFRLLMYRAQTLVDLNPASRTIQRLTEDCLRIHSMPQHENLRARQVIFGANDKVVDANSIPLDPPPIVEENQGHISVCKPTNKYKQPLAIIKELMA